MKCMTDTTGFFIRKNDWLELLENFSDVSNAFKKQIKYLYQI